jgi:hypothetical protein
MAIAGSMTTAYKVKFNNGKLSILPNTYPSLDCISPRDAIGKVRNGEPVIIAGSDMPQFNELWKALV